ncbi:MAG: LysR family transcriptional regulator [Roseitalea sp.]|jgi:DNA-binding transcriptional LysR family regulator|nr:LysR family transcriptional regulator [Roseitalea sp.]MBO6721205.1 LysR family transcriptional regulator [Roseitalea sp.]MBO6744263.1 LysR family transcriptional regulator [Roseitalea sp.]
MTPIRHRLLSHFLSVYRHRQIGRAAEAEGVTQPAMTKSIQKLETLLAVPLFERQARGAEPTKFAHILFRHAQRIEDEMRYAVTELANVSDGLGGRISIGVGPSLSLTVFPACLADVQRRFPRVAFDVVTGVNDQLLPQIVDGSLDVWAGSVHELDDYPELVSTEFGVAEMAVFCAADHPLTRATDLAVKDLEGQRWGFFRDDVIGPNVLRDFLAPFGVHSFETGLRCDSIAQLFGAAALSNLLIYAADTLAIEAEARGLARLSFNQKLWSFPLGVAYKPAAGDLSVVRSLVQSLQAQSLR